MESAIRYCRRCEGNTDHHRDRDGGTTFGHYRLAAVRWLALVLVNPWLNPWRCEVCELRDARERTR
jgi:hypothetical protein